MFGRHMLLWVQAFLCGLFSVFSFGAPVFSRRSSDLPMGVILGDDWRIQGVDIINALKVGGMKRYT
jgi:hypothetical protein